MTKWPRVGSSLRCAEELCHTVTTPLCHEAVSALVSIYLMTSVCLYHHCHLINGIAARPPHHHVPGVWISTLLISSYLEFCFQPFVKALAGIYLKTKHFIWEFVTTYCNCCDVSVSQFPCFLWSEVVIIELYHLDQLPCLIIIQFLPQIEVSNTANWNFLIDYLPFYRITNINSHTSLIQLWQEVQDTQLSLLL